MTIKASGFSGCHLDWQKGLSPVFVVWVVIKGCPKLWQKGCHPFLPSGLTFIDWHLGSWKYLLNRLF
jgi:hypothetical protein